MPIMHVKVSDTANANISYLAAISGHTKREVLEFVVEYQFDVTASELNTNSFLELMSDFYERKRESKEVQK